MSTPIINPPPLPTKAELEAHITKVRENLKTYIGKPGHNPFVFNVNVSRLATKLATEAITPELAKEILALDVKLVPLAKGAEHNATNPPKEAQSAGGNKPIVVPSSEAPKI